VELVPFPVREEGRVSEQSAGTGFGRELSFAALKRCATENQNLASTSEINP
jgi:hypothetical protein